ncbi:hypothetical protein NDU88_003332 [Pleurodeles waltl]|uniref:Uncharacterized protein n=1 Tax=Pleurodeles waltl TaxID=8319 RepID=A0AAV7SE73_PLEWA|nr:hypothetical protein NDU88_003332 [Pleurodeles waltl]
MGRHPNRIGATQPRLGAPSPGIWDHATGPPLGREERGRLEWGGGSGRLPPSDFLRFHCWGSLPRRQSYGPTGPWRNTAFAAWPGAALGLRRSAGHLSRDLNRTVVRCWTAQAGLALSDGETRVPGGQAEDWPSVGREERPGSG